MATFTLMFLFNDGLVYRGKTVPRALKLWCMWCTCFLSFSQFWLFEIIIFRRQHASICLRHFHWKRHQNSLNLYPIINRKMRIKLLGSTETLQFSIQCNGNYWVRQGRGILHWMWWIPFSIAVMHGTLCHKIECWNIRNFSFRMH